MTPGEQCSTSTNKSDVESDNDHSVASPDNISDCESETNSSSSNIHHSTEEKILSDVENSQEMVNPYAGNGTPLHK